MLVLSRKPSQRIVIGSEIRLTVIAVESNRVRLGIEAPRAIKVARGELVGVEPAPDRPGAPGVAGAPDPSPKR